MSHPLPHLLCPHSQHNRNGMEVSLICNLSKIPQFPCVFIRYCTSERCIKMIPNYQQKCKYLSPKDGEIEMSKKKVNNVETGTIENLEDFEVIESIEETYSLPEIPEIPKVQEKPRKTEMCRILYIKPNVLAFDFKGYGIHISTEHILDQDIIPKKYIEVEYESDIGKPDFKYYLKFQ